MKPLMSIVKKLIRRARKRSRGDFLRHFPKHAVGAEIGVFRGLFTKELLLIAQPRKLHLIDGWWEIYGEYFPWVSAATGDKRLSTREAYSEAEAVVAEYDSASACQFHVQEDLKCLEEFPDQYFDWVYLDSSHDYEHTKLELDILEHKVKPNGFIAGHDWYPDPGHIHHGVFKAVSEFCNEQDWSVDRLDLRSQWLIRRS